MAIQYLSTQHTQSVFVRIESQVPPNGKMCELINYVCQLWIKHPLFPIVGQCTTSQSFLAISGHGQFNLFLFTCFYLGVDPLSYFSYQPVLHSWCNKGRGMCYPVYGMVHIKGPLLLIGKSSPCGGSRFPLSLSEWSFTICPTPYNRI